ncbi:MAG: hypothetical protein QOJ03_2691 [Frankiaceae bacterium]|jgi:hypothetical protein|nr:hypothetical protein [Frankiaceae bacterium]
MTPVDVDGLAELVADARMMPAAMLPRPRTASPVGTDPAQTVDLTAAEVRIPAATVSLVDGYADYGV